MCKRFVFAGQIAYVTSRIEWSLESRQRHALKPCRDKQPAEGWLSFLVVNGGVPYLQA